MINCVVLCTWMDLFNELSDNFIDPLGDGCKIGMVTIIM